MAKEKKVSIKFYPVPQKGENRYAIYCRVIHNRKSTKFSLHTHFGANSLEDATKHIDLCATDERYMFYEKFEYFRRLIRFEKFRMGDKFDVTGLGNRLNNYQINLLGYLIVRSFNLILDDLNDKVTHKIYTKFQSFLAGPSDGLFYINLLKALLELHKSKDLELFKTLSTKTINALYCTGFFAMYEESKGRRTNNVDGKMVYNDGLYPEGKMQHFFGFLKIGHWVINEASSRRKFVEYIESNDPLAPLNEYTNGTFKEIFDILDFNYENGAQISSMSIELLISDITRGRIDLQMLMVA